MESRVGSGRGRKSVFAELAPRACALAALALGACVTQKKPPPPDPAKSSPGAPGDPHEFLDNGKIVPPREYSGVFTLTLENDILSGSDNNYSNGFGFSWSTNEVEKYPEGSFYRGWAGFWSFLPFIRDEGYQTYLSWTVAQETHTPDDATNPNPPPGDQPYAGVLYMDNTFHARRESWGHLWNLRLGIVGPSSHAEQVQTDLHEILGSDEPQGWDTQLPDEFVFNASYTAGHIWVMGDWSDSLSWRVVPLGTLAFGNYFTGANATIYGEAGWNLGDALGVSMLRQGLDAASVLGSSLQDGWSCSLFGGVGGYAVAYYLPLDGTYFEDSNSVDSNPLVGSLFGGLSLRYKRFVMGVGRTYFSETFEGQVDQDTGFGVLSLSWYF